MLTMLTAAKAAKMEVSQLTTEQKNAALKAMADALIQYESEILAANAMDLEAAKGTVSDVMLDRLLLTPARIAGMAQVSGKSPPCRILPEWCWRSIPVPTAC